jgi:acetoin utilization deacetylase AcuC-like enzyme
MGENQIRVAFHPIYTHPLPEGHRFPMAKYDVIPEQLQYEGTLQEANFFQPRISSSLDAAILRVHAASYVSALQNLALDARMIRKIGFPLSQALIDREWLITQGTLDCCQFALSDGISLNIAGGTHHAFADRGEGFCLLNDVAVAAAHVLDQGWAKKILVVDLDVHQGNGTAAIFQGWSSVFTFSMHGKDNYPLHKEVSDWDIPLPTGTTDSVYLAILGESLATLAKNVQPDFIFYIAGVDVLATDTLGKLGMTLPGVLQRDHMVLRWALRLGLPVVISMGGGYSPRLADIVEAHCQTYRLAAELVQWEYPHSTAFESRRALFQKS